MKIFCIYILLLFAALSTLADGYGPFEDGQHPKPFPVFALTKVLQGDESVRYEHLEFIHLGETNVVLRLFCSTNESCGVNLVVGSDKHPVSVDIEGSIGRVVKVYAFEANLNGDGTNDYIIRTGTGGCGLAAYFSFMTFVLSSKTGYVAHCIFGYCDDPENLVDMDNDGKPEYIHTILVPGEPGADGRSHNYWVHNLISFSGTNIVSANSKDIRFPKWVWYTFKDNHKDTKQLTGEQKKRLWLRTWESEKDIYKKPMFINPELFADEQDKSTKSSNVRTGARH